MINPGLSVETVIWVNFFPHPCLLCFSCQLTFVPRGSPFSSSRPFALWYKLAVQLQMLALQMPVSFVVISAAPGALGYLSFFSSFNPHPRVYLLILEREEEGKTETLISCLWYVPRPGIKPAA